MEKEMELYQYQGEIATKEEAMAEKDMEINILSETVKSLESKLKSI